MLSESNDEINIDDSELTDIYFFDNVKFHENYDPLRKIGEGKFGKVFVCKKKNEKGSKYAVKLVKKVGDNERQRREVDNMHRLPSHPNIIRFYESYSDEEKCAIIMEYCPGKDLDTFYQFESDWLFFSEDEAKIITKQLLSALEFIHQHDEVHRDVKPENIMVLESRDISNQLIVKLFDFGVSKYIGIGGEQAKTVAGTPVYMAPEIERIRAGEPGVYGPSCDCWSMGVLLYFLLMASYPEFSNGQLEPSKLDIIIQKNVMSPKTRWNSTLSPEVKDLVSKLLIIEPVPNRLTMTQALCHPWLTNSPSVGVKVRSSEDYETEISALRAELVKERAMRMSLDEECNALAKANQDLVDEIANLLRERNQNPSKLETTSNGLDEKASIAFDEVQVFIEGDGFPSYKPMTTIANAHGGVNVLSTSFLFIDTIGFVLSGGVDGYLNAFDIATGIKHFGYKLTAPVLAIDCFESWIACSLMDGGHALLEMVWITDGSTGKLQTNRCQLFRDHTKYVVAIKWNANGNLLATCSHDKSIHVYTWREGGDDPNQVMHRIKSIQCLQTPETIVFRSIPSMELIVGLRESCHLLYVSCETFESRQVSMNEKEWDTHVSFTALHLSLSPDEKCLLIATDKDKHIVLRTGSSQRLRILSGHNCGDYGKPIVIWERSGKYVMCNSEKENEIMVYCLARERIVTRLSSHNGLVRSIAGSNHPMSLYFASASYDKSVIVWSC